MPLASLSFQIMTDSSRKRLFIGIPCQPADIIPGDGDSGAESGAPGLPEFLHRLTRLAGSDAPGLRPVPGQNLHLTLSFLGSTPVADIALIRQAMEQAISAIPGFELTLRGAGCFRHSLWLGVASHEVLSDTVNRLNRALASIGMSAGDKRFVPHVTVARWRPESRFKVSSLLADIAHRHWGRLPVAAVHLYESRTLPQGAVYSSLHSSFLSTHK